jgi:hypothetical protein
MAYEWWQRVNRVYQANAFENDMEEIHGGEIAKEAETLKCNAVIVDAGGGISTFYPTSIKHLARNPFLQPGRDFLGEIVAGCKERGIRIFARNDFGHLSVETAKEHPEWALRNWSGELHQVYDVVSTCPTSEMFLRISVEAFKEQIEKYDIDGIYINGLGGRCCCDRCKKLFEEQTRLTFPENEDWEDPVYHAWIEWGYKVVDELAKAQYEGVKSVDPEKVYFIDAAGIQDHGWIQRRKQDFASAASFQDMVSTESFNDLAIPYPRFLAPIVSRFVRPIAVHEKKPGYVFVSSFPGHSWPNSNQPVEEFRAWGASVYLNGLSLIVPFYGHLNQDDLRVVRPAAEVFGFADEHADLLTGAETITPVAVVWSRRTLDHYGKEDPVGRYYKRFFAVCTALLHEHIPFCILPDSYIESGDLAGIKVLVLPNTACMSSGAIRNIESFVQNGGSILATFETSLYDEIGESRTDFGLSSLGVQRSGQVRQFSEGWHAMYYHSYMRITDTQSRLLAGFEDVNILPFKGSLIPVKTTDQKARIPLTFIPESPAQPPEKGWIREFSDMPIAVIGGDGKTIYFPCEVGEMLARFGLPDHRRLIGNAVRMLSPLPISTTAPSTVEITLLRKGDKHLVGLVNHTSSVTRSELIPIRNFSVMLRGVSRSDVRACRGTGLSATTDGENTTIEIEEVGAYDLIVLE